MKTPSLLLAAATIVGFAADAPPPKAEDVAKNYGKLLTRVTEIPKVMGRDFMYPCANPFEHTRLTKKVGPHFPFWVTYYRDDLAQRAGAGKFPVGSVIVKDKQLLKHRGPGEPWDPKHEDLKTQAIAGMIKRAKGTFPKSGDWEFFWFEEGELKTTGMESCAGCHSGAKRDYVFTELPKKAK